jgi:two-component system, chemotaxis family, response regulator Rcp1
VNPDSFGSFHVLLIEDSQGDAYLLSEAIREAESGCRISHARDGEEAMELLGRLAQSALPDLVFLDLHMPKKDGHQVLEFIKSDSRLRRMPVAMLSSSQWSPDIEKAYDLGVNCYLLKPVDPLEYFDVVGRTVTFFRDCAVPSNGNLHKMLHVA